MIVSCHDLHFRDFDFQKACSLITRRGARASSDMQFFRDAPGSGVVDAVDAKHKVSFATKPVIANVAAA
jgi:hypothetical protein